MRERLCVCSSIHTGTCVHVLPRPNETSKSDGWESEGSREQSEDNGLVSPRRSVARVCAHVRMRVCVSMHACLIAHVCVCVHASVFDRMCVCA